MPGWLTDIFRSFFFFIDGIIYKFIDTVYSLFLEIANTSIFTEDMINEFAGKVYALVGIFMLFKVSFSLLTYIINPDEFADKSKGMGKLIKNIITSLMLFILVPIIFREAMDIQRIILKDDIIPRIFSTSTSADISVSSQDPSMGSEMAVITFKAFYEIDGNYDLQGIFNTDVNQRDSSDNYIVKYTYLISSAVGVVLLLILISFCFDIAVRSVKLGFLRLIAPVPIMTRIDPKKGSELFNKWIKTCTSTYLDLFMRLAAIFFAIYIIKAVTTSAGFVDAVTGDPIEVSTFAIVFIILGALMFAKQLPKLIEDLLGIKLSGNFSLNPVKKLREVPLASAALGGAAGAVAGSIGSFQAHKDLDHNLLHAGFGALGGIFSGFARGAGAGLKDDGKGRFLSGSLGAARKGAQNIYKREGTTFGGRTLAGIQQGLGLNTDADELDEQIKVHETYAKFKSRLKEQADYTTDNLQGNAAITALTGTSGAFYDAARTGAKGLKQYYEDLQKSGTASIAEITAARSAWEEAQQIAITNGSSGSIRAIKAEAARYVENNSSVLVGYSTNASASYSDINTGVIASQNEIVTIQSSAEYATAQANKKYREKK